MGIKFEKNNHIATITINNPDKANIMDRETSDQLNDAWIEIWEDQKIRVTVITGSGDKYFCAGHNLAPRPDVTDEEREFVRTESIFWPPAGTHGGGHKLGVNGRMGDHFPQVYKPVVAAVNGWAAGAGFYTLLSTADIRVASQENAKFKFALLDNGWVGGGPGATLLSRQISHAHAMKILLTDEPFNAEKALEIGLINEVVPHVNLMDRAYEIAELVSQKPPNATRMMKELITRFRDIPADEAWRVQTLMNQLLVNLTTDGEEGRKAFLEKRKPKFTGGLRKKGDPFEELTDEQRKRIDELKKYGGA